MARTWKTLGRELGSIVQQQAPKLLRAQGPKVVRSLQRAGVLPTAQQQPGNALPPGRPVAAKTMPTSYRAREIAYSPQLDGRADPGEIVWTWVEFEEDPGKGKDRPVLVVGRDHRVLLGLMLSSNSARAGERNWLAIGAGPWDYEGRPSWLRLDRVLDVPEAGIRREGAILSETMFEQVAKILRDQYGWR